MDLPSEEPFEDCSLFIDEENLRGTEKALGLKEERRIIGILLGYRAS